MPNDKEKQEQARPMRDGGTHRTSSRLEMEQEDLLRSDYGTSLPGTPEPPPSTRYLCKEHGTILEFDVLWKRDERGDTIATCPYCGRKLVEQR